MPSATSMRSSGGSPTSAGSARSSRPAGSNLAGPRAPCPGRTEIRWSPTAPLSRPRRPSPAWCFWTWNQTPRQSTSPSRGRAGGVTESRCVRSPRRRMTDASQALAEYARDEAGRLVASLTRQLGNFDLAEESVQDAIGEALRTWPARGVPEEPGAWLRVAARRKATDRLRRSVSQHRHLIELAELDLADCDAGLDVADDRLVLLFMCCHPTLSREAQLALILRSVLGLTTAQVAKAFLTTEATMGKRIVRAKRKVTEARIPFEVPTGADAQARLQEVLTSVYVMFNEGYLSAGPEHAARSDLVDDAVWLASLLTRLLPDEPEVVGLQCLFALHRARDPARFDRQGEIVLL